MEDKYAAVAAALRNSGTILQLGDTRGTSTCSCSSSGGSLESQTTQKPESISMYLITDTQQSSANLKNLEGIESIEPKIIHARRPLLLCRWLQTPKALRGSRHCHDANAQGTATSKPGLNINYCHLSGLRALGDPIEIMDSRDMHETTPRQHKNDIPCHLSLHNKNAMINEVSQLCNPTAGSSVTVPPVSFRSLGSTKNDAAMHHSQTQRLKLKSEENLHVLGNHTFDGQIATRATRRLSSWISKAAC